LNTAGSLRARPRALPKPSPNRLQSNPTLSPHVHQSRRKRGNNMAGLIDRGSYKKGGKVKKTGKAMLHAGEYVLNAKKAKAFKKKLNVESSDY
jgi:hypothetical protein